jgi:parvulin-like peptidyl-prolyl isomerase
VVLKVEEFDVILFSMNPGEISPVFQTNFGYHIATVYDIRKEEKMTLSECIDDVKQLIHNRMVEEMLNQWLEKVKKKANIKIEY